MAPGPVSAPILPHLFVLSDGTKVEISWRWNDRRKDDDLVPFHLDGRPFKIPPGATVTAVHVAIGEKNQVVALGLTGSH